LECGGLPPLCSPQVVPEPKAGLSFPHSKLGAFILPLSHQDRILTRKKHWGTSFFFQKSNKSTYLSKITIFFH
jgi:hypothetical protein